MNKSNQLGPLTARHRIGYALGDFGGCMTFGLMAAFTIFGIKALCLLFPAACALGSWLVFRFIWNITPELRQQIAAAKAGNT